MQRDLLLSLLLAASLTSPAAAQEPADAQCDPLALSDLRSGPLAGSCGWSTVNPERGETVGGDYFRVREGELVLRGDRYRRHRWAWVPIPAQDDVFVVTIRVRVDNGRASTPPNFSLNVDDSANYARDGDPAPFFPELGAMLYLQGSTRRVVGRDGDGVGGGAFKAENRVVFDGNATYTMTATIDPTRGTYDMEASVDDGPPVVVADGYRFRRDPVGGRFNSVSFWVAGLDRSATPVRVIVEEIRLD